MNRKELLGSAGYWIAKIQTDLFRCAKKYMSSKNINQKKLAEELGVSKGYISQVLNGDYDHRMSKFIKLSLSFGYVPYITFKPLNAVFLEDAMKNCTKGKESSIPFVKVENNINKDLAA